MYSCQSGASDNERSSIAEIISRGYPNATIIGFNGYVYYGGSKGIVGVSSSNKTNYNDGQVLYFRNGSNYKTRQSHEYFK